MKNAIHLLHLAFFAILFITALTYVFRFSSTFYALYDIVFSRTDNEAARESNQEALVLLYTEADILSFLMIEPLDIDIEVNGRLIKRNGYNASLIGHSLIEEGVYYKEYVYDPMGKLIKICYERRP